MKQLIFVLAALYAVTLRAATPCWPGTVSHNVGPLEVHVDAVRATMADGHCLWEGPVTIGFPETWRLIRTRWTFPDGASCTINWETGKQVWEHGVFHGNLVINMLQRRAYFSSSIEALDIDAIPPEKSHSKKSAAKRFTPQHFSFSGQQLLAEFSATSVAWEVAPPLE